MERDELHRIVVSCINEFTGREYSQADIDEARSPMDYGVDSLNVLQILGELEDKLKVDIDLGRVTEGDVSTVGAVLDFLEVQMALD